jgi:hypothetical protein
MQQSLRGRALDRTSMRRYLTLLAALAIVATTLAVALVVVAPAAQVERAPPTGKANRTLVGLLVFSSDGKQLGKVLAEGIDEEGQPVLVADDLLGLGLRSVAIPTYMYVLKSNRILLTITAEEVANTLARPHP